MFKFTCYPVHTGQIYANLKCSFYSTFICCDLIMCYYYVCFQSNILVKRACPGLSLYVYSSVPHVITAVTTWSIFICFVTQQLYRSYRYHFINKIMIKSIFETYLFSSVRLKAWCYPEILVNSISSVSEWQQQWSPCVSIILKVKCTTDDTCCITLT